MTCCAGWVKADREGRRRQHALALGEGLVQPAVQPSLRKGWRGGVGPPELWQSAIHGEIGENSNSWETFSGFFGTWRIVALSTMQGEGDKYSK